MTFVKTFYSRLIPNNVTKHRVGLILAGFLCSGVFCAAPIYAEEFRFPGLEALMSEEEFANAGLNQLSPAQRASLNRWLSQRARFKLEESAAGKAQREKRAQTTEAGSAAISAKNTEDKSQEKSKKTLVAKRMSLAERTAVKPIRTRIVGKFTGWTGTTLFALENGEYWKQRHTGRYYYKAESPEVELFKNRFGFWEMRIIATGKSVKVSRYEP